MSSGCRLLRLCLQRAHPERAGARARSCSALQRRGLAHSVARAAAAAPPALDVTHDYEKRLKQLEQAGDLAAYYPQNPHKADRLTAQEVHEAFKDLRNDEVREDVTVTVFGRVSSRRSSGSKLVFIDLYDRGHTVQGLCNYGKMEPHGVEKADFKRFQKLVRKGDIYAVTGHPNRTPTGELSILATELPRPLAPSLHQLPDVVESPETLARQPHVDFLVHPSRAATQRVRAAIVSAMRRFFDQDGFMEVNTPLLTAGAAGAAARPFETRANEFPDEPLTLRIAPELFLKRLVIGTGERLYEIGTVFRNEGVDATHNPEFTICEFYEPYATLDTLIQRTETLFSLLHKTVTQLASSNKAIGEHIMPTSINFSAPFQRLSFIPTIENAIKRRLPNLSAPTAFDELQALFKELNLEPPADATVPRLLDTLAEYYIEPLCYAPTFITHHPEIMSPLAKSYTDPVSGQAVSRRVELFIEGREYVNAYEEENSPFAQRRKFENQLALRDEEARGLRTVDESYLEALEWGLPPTGGWGCGVDRLVMLFAGVQRVADVQPFGSLRNVVALGKGRPS